jgi:hypothetical protein
MYGYAINLISHIRTAVLTRPALPQPALINRLPPTVFRLYYYVDHPDRRDLLDRGK